MGDCFKFGKNGLIMETHETIENLVEVVKQLPEEEQKKVNLFAEKILAQLEDRMLTQGMMRLQEM